ncbi:MAG: glycosyltransferase [Candidatus Rokubacteria bacterium]|nr:glycosyltransferase [Candidatus Rokubacteria bacterium]
MNDVSDRPCISVIIPFYNAGSHLERSVDLLLKQDFKRSFEIIMVDDASTDNGRSILEALNISGLRLYSLPVNAGPAAARNLGLKNAKGEFVFFLDVDDRIAENALSSLYEIAIETDSDLVMCDKEWIENSRNQRENLFAYPSDRTFEQAELMELMRRRFYEPTANGGIFDLTGRLFRRSIIVENNILFEEKLRYLEDETFAWDVLGEVRRARYLRKQLYSYYVHPNVSSALSEGIDKGFTVSYFKLIKRHIENSLMRRGFSKEEVKKHGDQALMFFVISALVSYSKSMILGKVDSKNGAARRRKIIDEVIRDHEVSVAVKNYTCSKNESAWIPRAIAWRSRPLLEIACNRRAKEILRLRRKGLA